MSETAGLPVFVNIDQQAHFVSSLTRFKQASTHNFVSRFNATDATCAVNLSPHQIATLIDQDPERKHCRWFNFWGHTNDHHTAVAALAKHYGVSPRLTHMMCPRTPAGPVLPVSSRGEPTAPRRHASTFHHVLPKDVEKASAVTSASSMSSKPEAGEYDQKQLRSISDVADELWHFCSVDWGRRYVCIGYNALFSLPDIKVGVSKPAAQRIWSTLLLCDDGTMVSVFENPPCLTESSLKIVRQNQLNVFSHLSRLSLDAPAQNFLLQISIRPFQQVGQSADPFDALDGASLLFYYLFDDWINTYDLISRRQHPYRKTLEACRQDMMHKAEVDLVQNLHQVGRQLTVLKLVYQSYELILNRILQRQRLLSATAANTPGTRLNLAMTQSFDTLDDPGSSYFGEAGSSPTIRLTMGAIVRFERLLDRIRLYALNEIDECLAEKESLVFMNFNLVALKESQAVERLTRITILLAKATILFLPVSLMTAYFSMQLSVIATYTLKTYWLSFFVVIVLTLLFLLLFGFASHTVEGLTIYKSLGRMLWDKRRRQNKPKDG